MTKRFVEYDPFNGITTYADYDAESDTLTTVEEYDDLANNLDLCKALANDSDYTRKGMKDGWWHYAHFPNSIINKWLVEEGINVFDKNDQLKVLKKLYSPEYAYLRTSEKREFRPR